MHKKKKTNGCDFGFALFRRAENDIKSGIVTHVRATVKFVPKNVRAFAASRKKNNFADLMGDKHTNAEFT